VNIHGAYNLGFLQIRAQHTKRKALLLLLSSDTAVAVACQPNGEVRPTLTVVINN